MNLPNKLTISRMVLIPFIILFLVPIRFMPAGFNHFVLSWGGRLIALLLFVAASLTDLFDGKIARKHGLISIFGTFFDSIADKLLVISVFMAFVQLQRIHVFVPILVLARELAISGIRMLAAERGQVIAARMPGKLKTVTQMIALNWLLAEPILISLCGGKQAIETIGTTLVIISLVMTVWSFYMYYRSTKGLFKDSSTGA